MSDLPPRLRRYGRQLERAVAADLARRRRRTRIGAVAGVLALTAVIVNVVPGGGGERRLPAVEPASAVERAAAALKRDGKTILHVHIKARQYEDGRPDIRWENEAWIGPDAQRTVERPPNGPVAELEHVRGFDRLWDGERVLETRTGTPGGTPMPNESFREDILQSLRNGRARVTGRVRRGGRDAFRIVSGRGGMAYIVDARDYTPIELRTRGTSGGTVLRFVSYERLPLNDETRRLLSISAQHGNAPVVRDAAAYQAALTRLFPHG